MGSKEVCAGNASVNVKKSQWKNFCYIHRHRYTAKIQNAQHIRLV